MAQPQADKNVHILFNVSKKEYGNPNTTFKKIIKKYKPIYKCALNKEEITLERLKASSMFLIASPKEMFLKTEFDAMKNYLESGGGIFILSSDGGELRSNTNLNYLLEQYGISINNDCVVRTTFYKYMHPKEVYIQSGILNREVTRVALNQPKEAQLKSQPTFISNILNAKDDDEAFSKESEQGGLDFVYPYGATLNIQEPAHSILGTGALSYPVNRPIAAVSIVKGKGKLAVIGSTEMFTDEYLEKEENSKIFDFFLKFFLSNEVQFEFAKENSDTFEYQYVPDIERLADKLKSCLQESDDLPRDFLTLFDTNLFKFDVNLIPEAITCYEQMSVKHETLTLIPPQFETPMLGLMPATFPPILRELPTPNLELFDLDDEFASEKVRLAQLTNKCNNEDLDYFVKECGDILGVSDKVPNKSNAKSIIRYVLEQLVNFKKLNQG